MARGYRPDYRAHQALPVGSWEERPPEPLRQAWSVRTLCGYPLFHRVSYGLTLEDYDACSDCLMMIGLNQELTSQWREGPPR